MTDTKQTKCPHCGGTFRISDAQLAAKGGSVRCGSCLQVFRADLHLVGATPAPAPAAAPAKPKKKASDESWALDLMGKEGVAADAEDWKMPADGGGSDDFGFNDDDISEFMAKGPAETAPPAPGKSILFDDELSDQLESADDGFAPHEEQAHRLNENADESWAQEILSELETEEQKEAKKKYSMEILDGKSKPAPKNPKLAAAVGMAPRADDTPPPRQPAKAAARPAAPVDDFLGDDADVLSFLDNEDLGSASPASSTSNLFSLERPLAHVDAPVILKQKRDPIRWGYVLGWSFLNLVALALLASQYVFFNFEELAINPKARPIFERACQELGCRLPDIPDPSKLKINDLVVRKHASVEDAMVVDAIIKNDANFPQPFPMLRLRFRNNADEVIASRVLRPTEYLQGEARLMRRIPPETPVHISLEIVDPGQSAISYSLDPVL